MGNPKELIFFLEDAAITQLQAGELLSCCGTFPGANKNLK